MLYYQRMHDETLRKNNRKENTYLIWVHIFFCKFSHRVTLSRSFFIQTSILFVKPFFLSFSTWYIFLATFITDMSDFFCQFSITQKYIFLKKTNKTLVFSIFSSFIQNKTPSFFEKETERETIFLYFSRNSKHIFCFDKSQIFRILMTS